MSAIVAVEAIFFIVKPLLRNCRDSHCAEACKQIGAGTRKGNRQIDRQKGLGILGTTTTTTTVHAHHPKG
jgi:hypothetical protein